METNEANIDIGVTTQQSQILDRAGRLAQFNLDPLLRQVCCYACAIQLIGATVGACGQYDLTRRWRTDELIRKNDADDQNDDAESPYAEHEPSLSPCPFNFLIPCHHLPSLPLSYGFYRHRPSR